MRIPAFLVDTTWLATVVGAPTLRVFDVTIFLHLDPDGAGYVPESGRENFNAAQMMEWVADPALPLKLGAEA